MSQDLNQNTSQENQQYSSKPPRNNTVIYWIVIGVLLIVCIYMFVSRRNLSQQNDQTTAQLVTSDSSRKSVENDYNAALARLDQLVSKNSQMDSMINDKNGEVAKLKSQIQSILSDSKASAQQLAKAKDLINLLNSKTKSYEERIAELENENTNLTGQNQQLSKERDSTVTQNIALKKIGSVLHASNIRLVPLQLRKGGKKEKETTKAKRVDVLRIYFDIDENRIAEGGTKDIYLRITSPDGTILSNAAYGSGVTTTIDGKSLNYTVDKQVQLQQNQPVNDVTVDWHQDSDYAKGEYKIDIFNEGYEIGSGSVTLK
ncbi:MAG TPA: hypothetical protein VN721_11650 [Flavipsychrobacter sp.]|nr:hypothetical protein [Flavipsychrobacter sp.]